MVATKIIDPSTLKDWLKEGKEVTILDVRPDNERDEWYIPGSIHFNAYDQLKSGDKHAMDDVSLNNEVPVITVCARGRMSEVAAELLSAKGYEVYSLEGGMKKWNYAWDTSEMTLENVRIIQVRRVAKGCLSYIIGSGHSAFVIDASLDPSVYEGLAKEQGWSIEYVADTHIHADYVSRSRDLARSSGAKYLMNASAEVAFSFISLKNEEEIKFGNVKVKVIHTPGHTWESTSFLIENKVIFTGDTLFTDGIGRPDLKANKEEAKRKSEALYDSLQTISSLNENTLVMPAHISEPVKVGQPLISASIKELKGAIQSLAYAREKFIGDILAKLPASPPNYHAIAEINKTGIIGDLVVADLEAGANRCAIK